MRRSAALAASRVTSAEVRQSALQIEVLEASRHTIHSTEDDIDGSRHASWWVRKQSPLSAVDMNTSYDMTLRGAMHF